MIQDFEDEIPIMTQDNRFLERSMLMQLTSQQANLIRSVSLMAKENPAKNKIEAMENKAKKYQHKDELTKKKGEIVIIFDIAAAHFVDL